MIKYTSKASPARRTSGMPAVAEPGDSSVIEIANLKGDALTWEQVQTIFDRIEDTGLASVKVIQGYKSRGKVASVEARGEFMKLYTAVLGGKAKAPTYMSVVLSQKPIGGSNANIDLLTQALVDEALIKRTDPLELELKRRAIERIMSGTAWLTAKEVGVRIAGDIKNPHSTPNRLLSANRIFAIERRGTREFPAYQFDELGMPIPAVRQILEVFDGLSALQIASWFESTSSMLGGKRPRELLAAKPDAVIQAAKAHMEGPVHG